MNNKKAYFNWSGGKDSSLAMYHALQSKDYDICYLLTSLNAENKRISMHGVRQELLELQAKSLNIPLQVLELPISPTMDEYEKLMNEKVTQFKSESISETIFGDIFLEDLRKYREEKLKPVGINAHFPLWNRSTKDLMREFLDLGFKAIVVSINTKYLDRSFCGRIINEDFIKDLPEDVDICGENGEYHSFVFDGPIFKNPISYDLGEIVYKEYPKPKELDQTCGNTKGDSTNYGFYFCDLLPV